MGRGSRNQASSAQGLLYGRRDRGSGPKTITEVAGFDSIFDELGHGRLQVARHRLLPPRIDVNEGRFGEDGLGPYALAQVNNIWNEPVGLFARHSKKGDWLLIDYSAFEPDPDGAAPVPGTHQEMAFLKSLAKAVDDDDVRIRFAFEHEGQLSSFMSAYGPSPFKVVSMISNQDGPEPSQQEVLREVAHCGVLEDQEIAILEKCSNLTEAWTNPEACEALHNLADHGELCLDRPLSQFADLAL